MNKSLFCFLAMILGISLYGQNAKVLDWQLEQSLKKQGVLLSSAEILESKEELGEPDDDGSASDGEETTITKSNDELKEKEQPENNRSKDDDDDDDEKPKGRLYFKESFLQGSLKMGTTLGATQLLLTDTEVNVFSESELFNTNFDLFRATNVPFVLAQVEYMLFNSVGVGGFAGFSNSDISNRGTDGVVTDTEIFGTAFGGYLTYYQPVENWLYFSIEAFISWENGQWQATDGNNLRNYNFERFSFAVDPSFTIAPAERVQISFGLVKSSYSWTDYLGKSELQRTVEQEDGSLETITEITNQKIDKNELRFSFAPNITFLVTIFAGGGR